MWLGHSYSHNTDYCVSSGCFVSPSVSGGKERQVSSVGRMRPASPCSSLWCKGRERGVDVTRLVSRLLSSCLDGSSYVTRGRLPHQSMLVPSRRACCWVVCGCFCTVCVWNASDMLVYACGLTCSPQTCMVSSGCRMTFLKAFWLLWMQKTRYFSTLCVALRNSSIILWDDVIWLYMLPFEVSAVLRGAYSGSDLRSKLSGCFMDNR